MHMSDASTTLQAAYNDKYMNNNSRMPKKNEYGCIIIINRIECERVKVCAQKWKSIKCYLRVRPQHESAINCFERIFIMNECLMKTEMGPQKRKSSKGRTMQSTINTHTHTRESEKCTLFTLFVCLMLEKCMHDRKFNFTMAIYSMLFNLPSMFSIYI